MLQGKLLSTNKSLKVSLPLSSVIRLRYLYSYKDCNSTSSFADWQRQDLQTNHYHYSYQLVFKTDEMPKCSAQYVACPSS